VVRLDGPKVLDDVCLKVAAGQVIGIVGPSGSGKSTLTKLAQRLYVPEGGRILIDGIDLTVADVAWLRRQVGAVLQESVLFNPFDPREHSTRRSRLEHGACDGRS
jgi:subfamily B ATP-binding cassette protein HlyB/CyaB